ncbi:ParE toxin of type II toxin-antitoxin system, parDE [Prosthecobacter debontii]|uniref:ParE toxin of type II toxin-antitoxin system, parDE n=1 Tax=Prosthecobacter debontii TaxID=48467 RepID=A0A1T4WVL8_9BACT|nr:type II toxin-antitoxin system RelE/ParE family toxin [Prosthecobacter debontii]SKA81177.1 ParE toxin of type II toxin-antitoxin system, parDE [Prosthecobacter debontii]
MNIDFHPLAVGDLLDAQKYYGEINPALSKDFRQQLDLIVDSLFASPFHYHPLSSRSRFRRANMKRFPFNLIYEIVDADSLIRIVVVRHNKRHPSYGLNRKWSST